MLNIGDNVQIAGCSTKKRLLETSSGCESFDTLHGGALVNSSVVLIGMSSTYLISQMSIGQMRCAPDAMAHIWPDLFWPKDFITAIAASLLIQLTIQVIISWKRYRRGRPKGIQIGSPARETLFYYCREEQKEDVPGAPGGEEMKIAWRYENTKKVSSLLTSSGSVNLYDFSKHVENPNIEVYRPEVFSLNGLYKRLCEIVREEEAHTKSTGRGQFRQISLNFWLS